MSWEKYSAQNRRAWSEIAEVRSQNYREATHGAEFFQSGGSLLDVRVLEAAGDVTGAKLLMSCARARLDPCLCPCPTSSIGRMASRQTLQSRDANVGARVSKLLGFTRCRDHQSDAGFDGLRLVRLPLRGW